MESFIINHGEAGLLYRLRAAAAAAAAAAAGGSLRTAPAVDGRLRHWPIAMRTSCSGRHGVDDMHTTCRQRAADDARRGVLKWYSTASAAVYCTVLCTAWDCRVLSVYNAQRKGTRQQRVRTAALQPRCAAVPAGTKPYSRVLGGYSTGGWACLHATRTLQHHGVL